MARADLLCDLIQSGLAGESNTFRRVAEAICAEERAKSHEGLARKIEKLLNLPREGSTHKEVPYASAPYDHQGSSMIHERACQRRIEQLFLCDFVVQSYRELIEEHTQADLLRSFGVEPRNKVLLIGPPGNGKTPLVEAIATALMVPLYVVKYEALIGSYLGETASRLDTLFSFARTQPCVLFFDEFETLGKERGDQHETGEIKRVVSSLLLQIDALPSHVIVIAATNHESLLDMAAWRRFQIKLRLEGPTLKTLEAWLASFEEYTSFSFGIPLDALASSLMGRSYAEAEDFALAVYRQYILRSPGADAKAITKNQLELHAFQRHVPE